MDKVYAFDQTLRMPVISPMPLLVAEVNGMPESLLLGQRYRAELVLKNVGRTPLRNLRLRLSNAAFCVVGEDAPDMTIEQAAPALAPSLNRTNAFHGPGLGPHPILNPTLSSWLSLSLLFPSLWPLVRSQGTPRLSFASPRPKLTLMQHWPSSRRRSRLQPQSTASASQCS